MKKGWIVLSSIMVLGCFPLLVTGETVEDTSTITSTIEMETNTRQTTDSIEKTETDTTTEKKETSPTVEKTENIQQMPKAVQGVWIRKENGQEKVIEIRQNTYVLYGVEYQIKNYTVKDGIYTVIWDEQAYLNTYGKTEPWNPQPFIFAYRSKEDSLTIGSDTYSRKGVDLTDSDTGYVDKTTFDSYVDHQDVPKMIQGKWVAQLDGQQLVWTIGPRHINVNGVLDYKIVGYGLNGTQFTLVWSTNDYIERYGKPGMFDPQPFIFSYVSKDDTLVSGDLVFYRDIDKKTEETTSTTTKQVDTKKDKPKLLPQTSEMTRPVWGIVGVVSAFIGSIGLVIRTYK